MPPCSVQLPPATGHLCKRDSYRPERRVPASSARSASWIVATAPVDSAELISMPFRRSSITQKGVQHSKLQLSSFLKCAGSAEARVPRANMKDIHSSEPPHGSTDFVHVHQRHAHQRDARSERHLQPTARTDRGSTRLRALGCAASGGRHAPYLSARAILYATSWITRSKGMHPCPPQARTCRNRKSSTSSTLVQPRKRAATTMGRSSCTSTMCMPQNCQLCCGRVKISSSPERTSAVRVRRAGRSAGHTHVFHSRQSGQPGKRSGHQP